MMGACVLISTWKTHSKKHAPDKIYSITLIGTDGNILKITSINILYTTAFTVFLFSFSFIFAE
jgi:hypothetical protein